MTTHNVSQFSRAGLLSWALLLLAPVSVSGLHSSRHLAGAEAPTRPLFMGLSGQAAGLIPRQLTSHRLSLAWAGRSPNVTSTVFYIFF